MFRPLSYVDNWGILLRSCDAVDRYVAMLDIDLDTKKIYCWATDASGRASLRQQGFRVLLQQKELGAHVVFSRQLRNASTLERFRHLDDFWAKLTSCPCTYKQKVQLV